MEVDQAAVVEVGLVPAVNLAAATEAVQVLQALLGLTLARKRKQTPIHSRLIQNSNTPILLSKGIDLSFIKSFFNSVFLHNMFLFLSSMSISGLDSNQVEAGMIYIHVQRKSKLDVSCKKWCKMVTNCGSWLRD